jgi:hypothetical protein
MIQGAAMTTRRFAELLIPIAGFALLTAALFAQTLPHLSSALLGPPEDNYQDFWNSWYAMQSHADGFFFTRLIRAPEGASLYFHSFAYPQIALVWLLSRIFGTALPTLVLLQNLTMLLSFPLAALGGFYLCRHVSGSAAGGLAGGFVFAFNPWHIEQAMHHAHVAGIEFLPFFVLCYLLAIERHSFSWLAGAAAFFALSALSCWYYLFYCFYFLVFHLFYLLVHENRLPHGWRLAAPVLCLAGTGLLLSPLLVPMLLTGAGGDIYRLGSNVFVADLAGYTVFPPTHLLGQLGAEIYRRFTGNAWEDTAYLGLVNIVLLAFGFWRARDDARRTLWYALGGMIFFVNLASGQELHWMGATLPIKMPDIVLSRLPFFAAVRTPARAMVFVYLFAGLGVAAAIATALKGNRAFARPALVAVALLMLLDFYPAHLALAPMNCSPGLAALGKDKSGVLDLPFGYAESDFYMTEQACHGHPIAQGIIARQLRATLANHLEVHDFATQRRQLDGAGIGYIVLHHPRNGMFSWDYRYEGDAGAYRRAYTVIHEDAELTILKTD